MTTREEIKKNYDYLLSMLGDVREEMKKYRGVVDVGIGGKEISRQLTDQLVYKVFVREKKKTGELAPGEVIPAEIRGVPTDVLVVPHARERGRKGGSGDDKPSTVLTGGLMIGNGHLAVGTLGCFGLLASGDYVIITNHHVLAEDAKDGAPVGQPDYHSDCCLCCGASTRQVGNLLVGVKDEVVDVAIAKVMADKPVKQIMQNRLDTKVIRVKGWGMIQPGDRLRKVGCISGHTLGKIATLHGPVIIDGVTERVGQIHIHPHESETYRENEDHKPAFSDHGDSGAVVVNDAQEIVGLMWGGYHLPDDPVDTTFATDFKDVLDALAKKGYPLIIPASEFPADQPDTMAELPPVQSATTVTEENNLRNRLEEHEEGRAWLEAFDRHSREVFGLVNHNRLIMVTWQRNQGPAFIAHVMKNLKDPSHQIPSTVHDVTLQNMMVKMAAALKLQGSESLKNDLEKYALDIIDIASGIGSVEQLFARLGQKDFAS